MTEPIVLICRKPAIRIAQAIIGEANAISASGDFKQGETCVMIAHLAQQNILVNAALTVHKPGSLEGELLLRDLYTQGLKDLIQRWHADDLKQHFGGN